MKDLLFFVFLCIAGVVADLAEAGVIGNKVMFIGIFVIVLIIVCLIKKDVKN